MTTSKGIAMDHRKRQLIIHVCIVVCLGLLIYSNTFHAPFLLDDEPNIIENPATRDLSYFQEPSKIMRAPVHQAIKDIFQNRYIGYLTFALNFKINGFSVAGYHIVNLVIHIINALLVYWIVILAFKTPVLRDKDRSDIEFRGVALFTALLFVCHPIQTQAVTYIVQRFASLATLFYLLSLSLFIRSRLEKSTAASAALYVVSLGSAILAMKTKEISFTLPIIVVLFEIMFFKAKTLKRALMLTPYVLTLMIIPMTLLIAKGGMSESLNIANPVHLSRWDYLITQFRVLVTYFRLFFPPVIQNLDYDYPVYHSLSVPGVALSLLFSMTILILGVFLYHRSQKTAHGSPFTLLISFGIFWYFITLAVESSIIPISDVIFEHRLYLPSVGFFLAITSSLMMIKQRISSFSIILGKTILPLSTAFILLFSGAAYARNSLWKDEVKIWADTVNKSPKKARPHHNLGLAYYKTHRLDEALREYLVALSIKPDYEGIHLNLGSVYSEQGNLAQALHEFKTMLKLQPDSVKAHNSMGTIYLKQGHLDEALVEYSAALEINPDYAEAHNNRGTVYQKLEHIDDALREFKAAVELRPDLVQAYNNIGNVYFQQGRLEESLREYQRVKKMSPDYLGVYISIGKIYHKQRRYDDALNECRTVLKFKPDFEEARILLKRIQEESH